MKKLFAVVALLVIAVGTVAVAKGEPKKVTDAQVQAVVDARLHQLLVKLNAERSLAQR